ncbi:MAG TPA: radical SAM protein [Vicinamibacterales bacterium]|nr:radical SAM protein [Vicinamibacterales bacterium]
MQASIFNVRVPLKERDDVFLMNTLTDAQLIVSPDVAALLDRTSFDGLSDPEREAVSLLVDNGFFVTDYETDRRNLNDYFHRIKYSADELHVTVLTTLQCNFACGYCYQGDREDFNQFAEKMTLETAARVAEWIEHELDRLRPEKFAMTFFGGEPLLNLPVVYDLAARTSAATQARGIKQTLSIITNGLLLTEQVVDRLEPHGLRSIKITLDGDRDTHDRMRPLRGGQGTFDRIIENIRKVAPRTRISIGGNFDETSADSFPALLDFIAGQDFADRLVRVNFKPIVRDQPPSAPSLKRVLPLVPVGDSGKPLGGTCMTSAGAGGGSTCDNCSFLDEKMAFLREETHRHGLPGPTGVPGGPCHVHHKNAHTIGPDGSLYACPGFTGEKALSTGHISGRTDAWRESNKRKFDTLDPWKECGDCAYMPTCAGGCLTASYSQLGDVNTPTCHKPTFESAVIALAHRVSAQQETVQ